MPIPGSGMSRESKSNADLLILVAVMFTLAIAALGAALVVSARVHARLDRRVDFLEREVSAITAIVLEDLGHGCRPTVAEVGR
jgi:hypothetical protein